MINSDLPSLQDSRIPTGRLPFDLSVEDHEDPNIVAEVWFLRWCPLIKTCEVRCELELQERSHHSRLVLGFLGFVLSRSGYLLLFCGNEGMLRGNCNRSVWEDLYCFYMFVNID